MYENLFFKAGKCVRCKANEVVVMGNQKNWGTGICSRCEPDSLNKLGMNVF